MNKPTIAFVLLFMSLVLIQVSFATIGPTSRTFQTTFYSKPSDNYYYLTTDQVLTIDGLVTYTGTEVIEGDLVCVNTPLDVLPIPTSVFGNSVSSRVQCPSSCELLDTVTPAVSVPAGIDWFASSGVIPNYNTLTSKASGCMNDLDLLGILSTINGNYYQLTTSKGTGRANTTVACIGTRTISSNISGVLNTQGMSTAPVAAVFTPTTLGGQALRVDLSVSDCYSYVTTWEYLAGFFLSLDCIYSDKSNTIHSQSVTGNWLNMDVRRGPVMNITDFSADSQIPAGSDGSFSVTVRNDGDVDMTVTPAGITFDAGFSYVVPAPPPPPFNLAPGENRTITGSIRAPANFLITRTVTISVPYMGAVALVGTCDDVRTASVVIGDIRPAPPTQLTLTVNVDPAGIIKSTGHNVAINATLTRGGQRVPPVSSSNYTLHRWDNATQSWVWAPGWSTIKGLTFTYTPSDTELRGESSITEPVHNLFTNEDWQVGVYRVTVSVRDDQSTNYERSLDPDAPDVIEDRSTYFVIYTIVCEERS